MIGLGTIINTVSIIIGGFAGDLVRRFFNDLQQRALRKTCGVGVLFIGIAGAMEGMLSVEGASVVSGKAMLIVVCLVLGAVTGELLGIENWIERLGEWLKRKTNNTGDAHFTAAFLTASLTVCIGAMAIMGSIQDGISGDYSTLAVKSVLDLIIVASLTSSMGRGCIFSALPVFVLEGSMTLLAHFVAPFMTETALLFLSTVGSILIFCVGMNLVWGEKVRVANLLPSVIFAVIASYLPIAW